MVIKNKSDETFLSIASSQVCPCDDVCRQKRKTAVNFILEKGACTAKDLHYFLGDKLGAYALRSTMEYLSTGKCRLIRVYGLSDNQKPPQFGRRGRLFYAKEFPQTFLNTVIIDLLAPLQKRLLDKFSSLNKQIYYFSTYDLRRLVPSSGTEVDYALERLVKLGLLSKVSFSGVDFYVRPIHVLRFTNEETQAIIDNKAEYAVVKIVHELIMDLYPANLMSGYRDRIRPHTQDILAITGGMSFDIFYQFFEPVAGKSYMAIDVYTRIPVTGYMVHSFAKKIEWAKTVTRNNTTNYLRDKTYGIIVFRNATRKAITIANRLGIRFLRLSDLRIDYKEIQVETEKFGDSTSS
jgi:hypothetical protein